MINLIWVTQVSVIFRSLVKWTASYNITNLKMDKTSATVLVLLTLAVTLVWCQPDAGTCNTAAVTQYVANNLGASCAVSFVPALYANVSVSVRDAALDTICTENCAGKLANWLLNDCSSKFNSTSLYYLCLRTGGSARVGRYCQYSIPPWFDADGEILTLFQTCENVIQQGQCTDQCAMQLQNFANQLGCCYQSLYNNTEFVQGAADIGELASQDVGELRVVGNPLLWSVCSVNPPGKCTAESFDFPMTDGSTKVLPHLSVLVALLLMVARIGFA